VGNYLKKAQEKAIKYMSVLLVNPKQNENFIAETFDFLWATLHLVASQKHHPPIGQVNRYKRDLLNNIYILAV
jgi:hypothetical protein